MTPINVSSAVSEINIAVEIISTEEYDQHYGYANILLNVNSKLVEDFNLKCEYGSLNALFSEILSNHIDEILVEANNQCGLEELLENDFDWFNLDPLIRITAINDIDISALYSNESQSYNKAEILGVEEDQVEDLAQYPISDLRCAIDRELLLRLNNYKSHSKETYFVI